MSEQDQQQQQTLGHSQMEKAGKDEHIMCPCCKQMTLKAHLNPNSELVDRWLSCAMTNIPFSHEYPLFGGRVVITARMLTQDQYDKLERVATVLTFVEGKIKDTHSEFAPSQLLASVRLNLSIPSIRMESAGKIVKYEPAVVAETSIASIIGMADAVFAWNGPEALIERLKAIYADMINPAKVSSIPVKLRIGTCEAHFSVYNILMDMGFDESFWKGIELV